MFRFTHAVVREPGKSVIAGLRADASLVPDPARLREEHTAYTAALRRAGLMVDVLPPLEAFPDSIFVEDPALVFPQGAILLRPGAPSREDERVPMREALSRHFDTVFELGPGEYADGGDVMVTRDAVFIGLSARTTARGAEALSGLLARLGFRARIVETPKSVLHLKTAVSLLDEETLLATPQMAASGIFDGFRIAETADGEDAAANALRVNDTVLIGAQFPRTAERVASGGFAVETLSVREIGKLDAGLSCMSLRWAKT